MKCANCGSEDHLTKDCNVTNKEDDTSGGDKEARKTAAEEGAGDTAKVDDNSGGDKEARKGKKKASGSDQQSQEENDKEDTADQGDDEEEEGEGGEPKKGLGGGSTGKTSKASSESGDDPANYAYTPDKGEWKLKIHDAKHVGGAVAAIDPEGGGFRGEHADIPSSAMPKVKAKVRAAWKKHNPDKKPEDMPEVLKSNTTLEQLAANASELSKRFAGAMNQGR